MSKATHPPFCDRDFASEIRERFANPQALVANHSAEAIGQAILRQLADEEQGLRIRMSNLGSCVRKLSFIAHGYEPNGREIDGRARITFAIGDMVEALVVTALRELLEGDRDVSLMESGSEQAEVMWMDADGHPDGCLRILERGKGLVSRGGFFRDVVLEVKSMSSYAFGDLFNTKPDGTRKGCWGPDDSKWWQLQGYLHATGAQWAYVVAICKDSGAINGFWLERDRCFAEDSAMHVNKARMQEPFELPRALPDGTRLRAREDLHKTRGTPNKRHGELPWQCCYCQFYRTCWEKEGLSEDVGSDWRGRPKRVLKVEVVK